MNTTYSLRVKTRRWWEKDPPAQAWRVRLSNGGIVELLMVRKDPPEWYLMKAYD